jgi:hypothetical protein
VNQRRRTQLAGAAISRKGKGRGLLLGHGRHGLLDKNEHTTWQPPKCCRLDIGEEHHPIQKNKCNEKETNECENAHGAGKGYWHVTTLAPKISQQEFL